MCTRAPINPERSERRLAGLAGNTHSHDKCCLATDSCRTASQARHSVEGGDVDGPRDGNQPRNFQSYQSSPCKKKIKEAESQSINQLGFLHALNHKGVSKCFAQSSEPSGVSKVGQ